MERVIKRVNFKLPAQKPKLRVCAYARVSSGKDAMLHSLSAQVSNYSEKIQANPQWQYCGVFYDEAITGTKEQRDGFQEMLDACRAGKIDLILTKSVSRFARNTVTLLEVARELKGLGIDIFFEEQNVHSMSGNGELMLSILASYAQEESRSNSENQKWRIRKNFEEGKPWCGEMMGYRQEDGRFIVVPQEAEIVKRIYSEFLSGYGYEKIMRGLNEDGITTKEGSVWHQSAVSRILRNYTYTGNLLLQRFYSENHITKKKTKNNGEKPMYHVEDAHEAIIDKATFEAVQQEITRRAEKYSTSKKPITNSPFSSLITCGICGKRYRRKTTATRVVWICSTYNTLGKAACASKQIPEETLEALIADISFEELAGIRAEPENTIVLQMKNGEEITRRWDDRSRSQSWTPEMRARTGQKTRERNKQNDSSKESNSHTCHR